LAGGGELSNHLKVGTFEDSRIKFYAGCIALGLGGFHTQNLVYKCLNPQSIMMDDHGYILLADFHWARFEL
jgi:serine/threonine protein kinase